MKTQLKTELTMSGHSKWSTIKRQKSVNDAARGKIFTRHARALEIAAREGGSSDPANNAKLAAALEMARADSLPKENITRAIKKGLGELAGKETVEKTYEGYGPAGVAFLLQTFTDNPNRTTSNIRHIFAKHGGKLAESGSVAFQFTRQGLLEVELQDTNEEALELAAIEAGALDLAKVAETLLIKVKPTELRPAQQQLLKANYQVKTAILIFEPQRPIKIEAAKTKEKVLHLIQALEENTDVVEVATNLAE